MSAASAAEFIEVAAGALLDTQGRVLLARRHDHAHQGGLWEFPGGKIDPDEEGPAALRRELDEEIGIEVVSSRPLIRVRHDYPDRRVLLDVWLVESWRGEPEAREGQALEWVTVEQLIERPMPAADRPIVNALRLPHLCLMTPAPDADRERFLAQLETALTGGVRLVVLRAPSLEVESYLELLTAAAGVCARHQTRLMAHLGSGVSVQAALAAGADGVHLGAAELAAASARPAARWVSAACHDAVELHRAETIGCDFALLSPVCTTLSHPETTPLGWPAFRDLVETVNIPVYALGGLARHDCSIAWQAGAQGIAAIRSLWPAEVD